MRSEGESIVILLDDDEEDPTPACGASAADSVL
jgi:hypothetical protein